MSVMRRTRDVPLSLDPISRFPYGLLPKSRDARTLVHIFPSKKRERRANLERRYRDTPPLTGSRLGLHVLGKQPRRKMQRDGLRAPFERPAVFVRAMQEEPSSGHETHERTLRRSPKARAGHREV